MRGSFIVIEGMDGTGKSTLAVSLARRLGACHVVEPSYRTLGQVARKVIEEGILDPSCLPYLFAADRAEDVKFIESMLKSGRSVVCDRYIPSSLVYHSLFHGWSMEETWELNKRFIQPDTILFLDVPPQVSLDRIRTRALDGDAEHERSKLANLERLRSEYQRAATNIEAWSTSRVEWIAATANPDTVLFTASSVCSTH